MYKITYKILPEEETKVIYGDSVTGDTPILVRNTVTGIVNLMSIENLSNDWSSYEEFKKHDTNRKEKQQSKVDYEIWSDIGWCSIRRVIRHKCDKKIYRVKTMTLDQIDVTEDHSLLNVNMKRIKPNECENERLLTVNDFPDDVYFKMDDIKVDTKMYSQYRFMLQKLSSLEHCSSKVASVEYLGNTNNYVYDIETDIGRFHAGIGRIVCSNTDSVFVRFESKTSSEYRKKANELLECSVDDEKLTTEVKLLKDKCMEEAFELGEKASKEITDALFKQPILLEYEKTYNPLVLLGKKMYIGALHESSTTKWDYIDKKGVALKRRDNCITGDASVIMEHGNSKLLRDIVVGDVIMSYNIDNDLLERDIVTHTYIKQFEPYINIEFFDGRVLKCTGDHLILKSTGEWVKASTINCYDKLVHGRKRSRGGYGYIQRVANVYSSTYDELMFDITVEKNHNFVANGVVVHNCHYLKDTYEHIVNLVMDKGKKSIKDSYAYLEERIDKLLNNDVDFDDLIITKKLNSEYKNENVVTLVLSKIMHSRDPGTAPKINERVPFIYVTPEENTEYGEWRLNYVKEQRIKDFIKKVNNAIKEEKISSVKVLTYSAANEMNDRLTKKIKLEKGPLKQYEKVEDPTFAKDNNLKIDISYYINNQLRNPLTQFLTPVVGKERIENLFDEKTGKQRKKVESDTGDGLVNLKVSELKELAKEMKLKVSGTKSELIIRIRESKIENEKYLEVI